MHAEGAGGGLVRAQAEGDGGGPSIKSSEEQIEVVGPVSLSRLRVPPLIFTLS